METFENLNRFSFFFFFFFYKTADSDITSVRSLGTVSFFTFYLLYKEELDSILTSTSTYYLFYVRRDMSSLYMLEQKLRAESKSDCAMAANPWDKEQRKTAGTSVMLTFYLKTLRIRP